MGDGRAESPWKKLLPHQLSSQAWRDLALGGRSILAGLDLDTAGLQCELCWEAIRGDVCCVNPDLQIPWHC